MQECCGEGADPDICGTHGTAVSGGVAARADNGSGIVARGALVVFAAGSADRELGGAELTALPGEICVSICEEFAHRDNLDRMLRKPGSTEPFARWA